MKEEPLRFKELKRSKESCFLQKDVKEAIKLYLRYKNKPYAFMRDYPEYKKIAYRKYHSKSGYSKPNRFDEWLFRFTFYDVMRDISLTKLRYAKHNIQKHE